MWTKQMWIDICWHLSDLFSLIETDLSRLFELWPNAVVEQIKNRLKKLEILSEKQRSMIITQLYVIVASDNQNVINWNINAWLLIVRRIDDEHWNIKCLSCDWRNGINCCACSLSISDYLVPQKKVGRKLPIVMEITFMWVNAHRTHNNVGIIFIYACTEFLLNEKEVLKYDKMREFLFLDNFLDCLYGSLSVHCART